MMRFIWLLWQFILVVAGGALLIGVVIAIWYGFSYLVLLLVGKIFRLRGRPPRE
jgi:hypothetical protein